MSGQQQVVAAGGATLVLLAFWDGPSRDVIADGLFHAHATTAQQQAAHDELRKLGAAAIFVVVATILSGISRQWGRTMTAVVVGLLLVWAVNKYRGGDPVTTKVATGKNAQAPGRAGGRTATTG